MDGQMTLPRAFLSETLVDQGLDILTDYLHRSEQPEAVCLLNGVVWAMRLPMGEQTPLRGDEAQFLADGLQAMYRLRKSGNCCCPSTPDPMDPENQGQGEPSQMNSRHPGVLCRWWSNWRCLATVCRPYRKAALRPTENHYLPKKHRS